MLVVAVVCLAVPMFFTSKTANADSPEIIIAGGQTSFEFSDFNNNQTKRIWIDNFAFEIGDKVMYYYINTNSSSFSYVPLYDYNDDHSGASEIIITEGNIADQGEITINLLKMNGAHFASTGTGEYIIKASIIRGSSVFTASTLKLVVNDQVGGAEPSYKLTISSKKVKDYPSEFGAYDCRAVLTLNNTVVPLDERYTIKWYFVHNNSQMSFNAEQFRWLPEAKGSYTLKAQVVVDGDIVSSNTQTINVSVDKTLEIVLVALGIAGVMTIGVVISVIVSVKRERVW